MPFVITAGPDERCNGNFRVEKATSKDAMEAAKELMSQDFQMVLITDESDRIYTLSKFVSAYQECG